MARPLPRPAVPGRRPFLGAVAAVGVAAALLAGCGDEGAPDPAEVRAERVGALADDLVTESDGALDAVQAVCVAEGLLDAVGEDAFADLVEAGTLPDVEDTPSADDGDDGLRGTVIDVFAACDALDPLVEADLAPDPAVGEPSDTTAPGD